MRTPAAYRPYRFDRASRALRWPRALRSRRCAGGFTLVEVLVALLVLAIGIAGAAGAQLAGMRTRHGSSLMAEAVQLASSLADRMRANGDQMRLDDARNPYVSLRYDAALDGAPPAMVPCYAGTGCGPAEMAAFDLAEVRAALHARFPGGRITVCRDATVWRAADKSLTWDCAATAGAPLVIKLGWRGRRAGGADDADAAGQFAPTVALIVAGAAP